MTAYREPFVLVIPQQLLEDHRLNFADKALWAYMSGRKATHRDPTIAELSVFFQFMPRNVKRIRNKLARLGYLQPHTDRHGVTSYVLLDPALTVFNTLRRFLSISQVFRGIPAEDLFALSADPDRLLYVMEVFEHTYQDVKKPVGKPLALLRKGLGGGVTPGKGFSRGWWIKTAENLERDNQAKRQADAEQRAADANAEAEEQRVAALWEKFNALPAADQQKIRARALDNIVAQGFGPEFASPLMRYEIAALVEKGGGNGSVPGV